MMFTITAFDSSRNRRGIMKLDAMISFVKNVAAVASQIALWVFFLFVSSEMWIPSASENASAIAIVRIPPITAIFNPVPVFSPIINPNVVMIPDVRPNDTPLFIDSLMEIYIFSNI